MISSHRDEFIPQELTRRKVLRSKADRREDQVDSKANTVVGILVRGAAGDVPVEIDCADVRKGEATGITFTSLVPLSSVISLRSCDIGLIAPALKN